MRRLFFHEESIHEVSRRYLEHEDIHTAAFTYYYDPVILENKLTPLSILIDLALRKRDSKKFIFYFYVFHRV